MNEREREGVELATRKVYTKELSVLEKQKAMVSWNCFAPETETMRSDYNDNLLLFYIVVVCAKLATQQRLKPPLSFALV